ncbi:SMC family ATPase [Bhargavaea ullalensis]|uniref:Nuclease SbcCD subunit C n=1 Tax=Bhargavaea ullalensis TaxID=1265685 RepID=A0ABV2G9G5_9BACL
MKPIQLKMTAFGPYKDCETIDFRELGGRGLFAISGSTGSGKTTIFDAICFALYGKASGEERDDKSLRSDFADDAVHTEVELLFEAAGSEYRIMRRMAHVKAGNKGATGDRIELFRIAEGKEEPVTDRQMTTEVNAKVAELIGFTHDQFSQIVMLPQGEFRKLLTSDTDNKEKIFRKIFRTKKYKDMEAVLKEKRDRVQSEWQEAANRISWQAKHLRDTLPGLTGELSAQLSAEHPNPSVIIGELLSEQERMNNDHSMLAGQTMKLKDRLQLLSGRLSVAKETESRFEERAVKAEELRRLEDLLPEIASLKTRVADAGIAARILPLEEKLSDCRRELHTAEKRSEMSGQELRTAKEAEQQALAVLEEASSGDAEAEKWKREADRLDEIRPLIGRCHDEKQALAGIRSEQDTLKKEMAVAKDERKKLLDEGESVRETLRGLEQELEGVEDLYGRLNALERDLDLLVRFKEASEKAETAAARSEAASRLSKEAEDRLDQVRLERREQLASELAGHLHDGMPCPVCGSAVHPALADHQESGADEGQLRETESAWRKAHAVSVEATGSFRMLLEQQEDLSGQLTDRGMNANEAGHLTENRRSAVNRCKEEIAAAVKQRDMRTKIRSRLETIERKTEEAAHRLENLDSRFRQLAMRAAEYEGSIRAMEASIPAELQDPGSLDERLASLKQALEKQARMKAAAEQAAAEAADRRKRAEQNLSFSAEQREKERQRTLEAEEAFRQAVSQSKFTGEEAYRAAILPESRIMEMEQAIGSYERAVHAVRVRLQELETSLEGAERPDLDKLSAEEAECRIEHEEAQEQLIRSKTLIENVSRGIADMREAAGDAEDLERKRGKVSALYDLLRGQNADKLSFERYLQIEYLERILVAANERLKDLSNGQFELMRSDRQESRGKQSGLGIDVYDAYTGQARDVKTLSGGEKFNASLSLALGMADVIQGFGGNVRVDTMFIDEGFGSLDPESLQKAVDALIGLQQTGRMVGVISHVGELKAAMPAVLEVSKSKAGHSSTRFILK